MLPQLSGFHGQRQQRASCCSSAGRPGGEGSSRLGLEGAQTTAQSYPGGGGAGGQPGAHEQGATASLDTIHTVQRDGLAAVAMCMPRWQEGRLMMM